MLKPSDPSGETQPPTEERPVGELVHELVENGKAYARAEVALAKATVLARASKLKAPAILGFSALLLLLGAATALGVGGLLGLAPLMGPFLAGLLVFMIMAGIAGGLAWIAARKIREIL